MTDRARVLFVDDEKRVLNSMRGLFRREFELFLTTEGAVAVKIAAEGEIDVIVADQRMPGMTGVEVLGKVKELSPRTIRILLTGYADPTAVEGSINVGEVFRFLSKPCPPQHLRETLHLAVDAARATADCSAQLAKAFAMNPATTPDQHQRPSNTGAETQSTSSSPIPPPVLTPATRLRSVPSASAVYAAQSIPTLPKSQAAEADRFTTSSHRQAITDAVLPSEISKQSQRDEIAARAVAMTKDVGVVVFTVDSQFAELAIRAVSTDRNTILATTLARAAHAFEQYDVGVLVTDFTTKSAVLQKIISTLKKYLPELVTIVVSGGRDTSDMINLINHGQVFRYLLKPIDTQNLRNNINAAAIKYTQLRKDPELVKRHQIQVFSGLSESSPTLNEFVNRIQNLGHQQLNSTHHSN